MLRGLAHLTYPPAPLTGVDPAAEVHSEAELVAPVRMDKALHPSGKAACNSCHNPHNSREPGLLHGEMVALCNSCHTGIAAQMTTATAQQPVIGYVLSNQGIMAGVTIDGSRITRLQL